MFNLIVRKGQQGYSGKKVLVGVGGAWCRHLRTQGVAWDKSYGVSGPPFPHLKIGEDECPGLFPLNSHALHLIPMLHYRQ